jgi:uncharacterized repeat protein (TIGR01451 family)
MRKRTLSGLLLGVCVAMLAMAYGVSPSPEPEEAEAQLTGCTVPFDFSGEAEDLIVPPGVTMIEVDIFGAAGGDTAGKETGQGDNAGIGGFGGGVTGGLLTVTPGAMLTVIVGGEGGDASSELDPATGLRLGGEGGFGYNGTATGGQSGGDGGDGEGAHGGGGGGGASAVLLDGELLAAAGGGGGGAHGSSEDPPAGAGGLTGLDGTATGPTTDPDQVGLGATPTAPGAGGTVDPQDRGAGVENGTDGGAGIGGTGGDALAPNGSDENDTQDGSGDAGGGGGGGLFGGGGAAGGVASGTGGGAGGGGGSTSNNIPGATPETGVQDGDGRVDISFLQDECPGDLQIEKSVSNDAPEIGEEITYTLVATNNGPVDPDMEVVVRDNLPSGVSYVSDDCGGVNGPLFWQWDIGDLAIDDPQTCNITVLVEEGGEFENTATIRGFNPDGNPDNNRDTVPIVVPPPDYDLEIVKEADPTEVLVGDRVTYTLTVTNLGPDDAEAAAVADLLPPKVEYVSDTCGGRLRPNFSPEPPLPPLEGTLWTWAVGELAVDETAECEITVELVGAGGSITNRAAVLSHGVEVGLGLANNRDNAAISARRPPPVAIHNRAKPRRVRPGQVFGYRITLVNEGDKIARDLRVCDKLSKYQRLLAAPEAQVSNDRRACWRVQRIMPGNSRVLRIVAQIKRSSPPGKQRNTVVMGKRRAHAAVRVIGG